MSNKISHAVRFEMIKLLFTAIGQPVHMHLLEGDKSDEQFIDTLGHQFDHRFPHISYRDGGDTHHLKARFRGAEEEFEIVLNEVDGNVTPSFLHVMNPRNMSAVATVEFDPKGKPLYVREHKEDDMSITGAGYFWALIYTVGGRVKITLEHTEESLSAMMKASALPDSDKWVHTAWPTRKA